MILFRFYYHSVEGVIIKDIETIRKHFFSPLSIEKKLSKYRRISELSPLILMGYGIREFEADP